MELIVSFIVAFVMCIILIVIMNRKKEYEETISKSSSLLYSSSNRNTYTKARDVFKILYEAGVKPNFLGRRYEHNEESAFNCMWNEVILGAIDLCKEQLDDIFERDAEVKVYDFAEYKGKLEYIYKRKREWLKSEYLAYEKEPVLDFHKLSALMCRAIIGVKPFCYNVTTGENLFEEICKSEKHTQSEEIIWQVDNVYVNYKLAYLVAEGISFVDLLFWAQQKINDITKNYSEDDIRLNRDNVDIKLDIYKKFIFKINVQQQRLFSYKTSSSHDDYVTSAIIALMKNDCLKRDFDYLQFSLSMFQWQEYTKKQNIYDILREMDTKLLLSDIV